jgi:hypothetical protein
MKKRLLLVGCFSFVFIVVGCSLSKDVPCGCLPPKHQKQEQQDNTLELREVVWSQQGKV